MLVSLQYNKLVAAAKTKKWFKSNTGREIQLNTIKSLRGKYKTKITGNSDPHGPLPVLRAKILYHG